MSMTKMFQCRTQHCVCRDAAGLMEVYNEFIVSMPHAALCVSRHDGGRKGHPSHAVSMPHAALCVSRQTIEMMRSCREELFQCRTQHCVCRDTRSRSKCTTITMVSMPHAALCVSRPSCIGVWPQPRSRFNAARSIVCVETIINAMQSEGYSRFQCRTQHCVCRDTSMHSLAEAFVTFQCRTQHCVCRDESVFERRFSIMEVSMPHAALCVSRPPAWGDVNDAEEGFNAARSIVCVETAHVAPRLADEFLFQCRTQHCVCRDKNKLVVGRLDIGVSMPHAALCVSSYFFILYVVSDYGFNAARSIVCVETVSRSPCPARAEKAFWKDALFCAVFGVCG